MAKLKIPIHFIVPHGDADKSTVTVKDDSGDWQVMEGVAGFKVEKELNGLWNFECDLLAISDDEKAYVKERAEIMFFMENKILLKGRIQKVDYKTAWECHISGVSIGAAKVMDRELIKEVLDGEKQMVWDRIHQLVDRTIPALKRRL